MTATRGYPVRRQPDLSQPAGLIDLRTQAAVAVDVPPFGQALAVITSKRVVGHARADRGPGASPECQVSFTRHTAEALAIEPRRPRAELSFTSEKTKLERTMSSERARAARALLLAVALATGPQSLAAADDEPATRPNIVLILTDDEDVAIHRFMPKTKALLEDAGTTFENFFVSYPFCCPSRASILRGQYAHNTQVVGNELPYGGFEKLRQRGLEKSTVATWLQAAGYRTALVGKYINRYVPETDGVPPGWSDWYAAGNAHPSYDYTLNENGRIVAYGREPDDYLNDVLTEQGGRGDRDGGRGAASRSSSTSRPTRRTARRPRRHATRICSSMPSCRGRRRSTRPTSATSRRWSGACRPSTSPRSPGSRTSTAGGCGRLQAIDDMVEAHRRRRSTPAASLDSDLHRLHLRQRLPHGRAPADRRQGYALRGRHPGADGDARSGRAGGRCGSRRWRSTSTSRRPSPRSPGSSRPAFVDGRSFLPLLADPAQPWRQSFLIERRQLEEHFIALAEQQGMTAEQLERARLFRRPAHAALDLRRVRLRRARAVRSRARSPPAAERDQGAPTRPCWRSWPSGSTRSPAAPASTAASSRICRSATTGSASAVQPDAAAVETRPNRYCESGARHVISNAPALARWLLAGRRACHRARPLPGRRGRGAGDQAQHRADPDRRRGRRLARVHAQDQGAARGPGHDVRQLLRDLFLLLPVAGHDPARPVSAQHADPGHPAADRRLRQVPQSRPPGARRSRPGSMPPATTPPISASISTSTCPSSDGVPPGWDDWHVGSDNNSNYNYTLNENGRIVAYGERAGGLSDRRGGAQVGPDHRAGGGGRRAVLPLRRDLRAAQPVDLGAAPRRPVRGRAAAAAALVRRAGRQRQARDRPQPAADDPAADRGDGVPLPLAAALAAGASTTWSRPWSRRSSAQGLLDNTYIVYTSDNGHHMGEHRMIAGKTTAYEEDIRVPMIVRGPGVRRGRAHRRHGAQQRSRADLRRRSPGSRRRRSSTGARFLPLLEDPDAALAPAAS